MKKQKNVFVEDIHMETQTVFQHNGDINIFPCEFERGQQIVANGASRVSQKGRMVTADDGASHFHPYRHDSGSRYVTLWTDPYTRLKMSKTRLVLTVNVPLDLNDPYDELSCWAEAALQGNTDLSVQERIDRARQEYINRKKH